MLANMARDRPHVRVIAAAGRLADYEANRFPLIEIFGSSRHNRG